MNLSTYISLVVRCLAVFALASFALASCGSSDNTSMVQSITKAALVQQADQICSKTEKRQLALVNQFQEQRRSEGKSGPPDSAAEAEIVSSAGVPPLERQIEELSRLPSPRNGAEEFEEYLKALEAGVRAAKQDPASLLSSDSNPFAKASSLAKDFGFAVCSAA